MSLLTSTQGAAAAEQARRLGEEVAAERERVRGALAALEAERARLDARSAAETERLQVQPGWRSSTSCAASRTAPLAVAHGPRCQ